VVHGIYQGRQQLPEGLPKLKNSILRAREVERFMNTKALSEYSNMGVSDIVRDEAKTYGSARRLDAAGWQSLLAQGMRDAAADAIDEVASQSFDRGGKAK